MTVELKLSQFKLDGDLISDIFLNAHGRTIAWSACVKAEYLTEDEANCLKKISNCEKILDRCNIIIKDMDNYSNKMISILNKNNNDDITRFTLVSIIDVLTLSPNSEFANHLLSTSHLDSSLPYLPLVHLLDANDFSIKLNAAYLLTLLLTNENSVKNGNEKILTSLFNFINNNLVNLPNIQYNYIGVQLLKELLSIKVFRNFYWLNEEKYFPSLLLIFTEKRGELQMKYNSIFCIWLLTFNAIAIDNIIEKYFDIIPTLFTFAKDAVKEKIVRLSVSCLLNLINVTNSKLKNFVIKKYLLCNGLDIVKQLIERKWADEELKVDLNNLLEILNDAVQTLTTFDEYENELKTKKLIWSPSHKSEEFWIENIEKFKENNWQLLKDLISLLEIGDNDNQLYLNQSIVCYDVSEIIKYNNYNNEIIKLLDKIGAKTKIMTLMSSPNSNVKFEALRTTQQLVAHSL